MRGRRYLLARTAVLALAMVLPVLLGGVTRPAFSQQPAPVSSTPQAVPVPPLTPAPPVTPGAPATPGSPPPAPATIEIEVKDQGGQGLSQARVDLHMGGTKIDSKSAAPRGKATLQGRKGTAHLLIQAAGYLECRQTLELTAAQQRLVCSLYKQANCTCQAR